MRDKIKFEIILKKLWKILKGHNILWTISLWKPLLNLEILKNRLKFCQDHQY